MKRLPQAVVSALGDALERGYGQLENDFEDKQRRRVVSRDLVPVQYVQGRVVVTGPTLKRAMGDRLGAIWQPTFVTFATELAQERVPALKGRNVQISLGVIEDSPVLVLYNLP